MARHQLTLPDGTASPMRDARVTWVGNATVLLEVAGFRLLTDPNFLHQGDHAKLGGGLRSRRLAEPAFQIAELLPLDLVVLSHHHGDHWDEVADRDIPKDVPIATTAHAARKLGKAGFERTYVLDTWEQVEVTKGDVRITITSLPGKHAPQPLQAVLPPVMGSKIGRASCRERVCPYVWSSVVAGSLKKKKQTLARQLTKQKKT